LELRADLSLAAQKPVPSAAPAILPPDPLE
jgi:hypothetical protein